MHNVSLTYYKKALELAYALHDQEAELLFYDKIAAANMNAGNQQKMLLYYKRVRIGQVEPEHSN